MAPTLDRPDNATVRMTGYARSRTVTYLTMLLIAGTALAHGQSSDSTFFSPTGRFAFRFKQMESNRFPDSTENNLKYVITFADAVSGRHVATDYHDVHWELRPAALSTIAYAIRWSPAEDFAILPEENWMRAPGSPEHHVLNLNPAFSWADTVTAMEFTIWLDSLTVIGDAHDDCYLAVSMFNGRDGRTIEIEESQSPLGYSLAGVNEDAILMQTEMDNCSSEEELRGFQSRLFSVKKSDVMRKSLSAPDRPH